jgi:hypothetical protein
MWRKLSDKLRLFGWNSSGRTLFSLVLGAGAAIGTASAHETSIIARVSAVRSALSEQVSYTALSLPSESMSGQNLDAETAQWVNWGNWANWANWNNWANWANWASWINA